MRRMGHRRSWTTAAGVALVIVSLAGWAWFSRPKPPATYVREAVAILEDYALTLETLAPVPPERKFDVSASAERVMTGVEDVQVLVAQGRYREADARLASMRRDLEDLPDLMTPTSRRR